MKNFKVGLIGAGYVSEYHIRGLRRLPNVSIVGVTDVVEGRARTAAQKFGLPAVFPSVKAMVDAGVEVVHVLTPPDTHAALILEALGLGCHVLVEKPLTTRVEDCDRIISLAKSSGKTVGVNHTYLRDPFVVQALNAVRSGALGTVLTVDYFRGTEYPPSTTTPMPPPYIDGGYPFRDIGVHALYLIREFLGEIQSVSAQFDHRGRDPNLRFDEWRTLVRCERGSGQIQISVNIQPLQHVLLLQGTNGVLRADMKSMFVTVKRTSRLPKAAERAIHGLGEGLSTVTQVCTNSLRFAMGRILPFHGLQVLVADFYRALAEGKPAPVTPEQAKPIVEWTERVACEADQAKRDGAAAAKRAG